MKFLSQRGDTIVEVLIAITVVSSVLAGAYAASNRNLKATRQAHEHSIALKYAEGQIEGLHSADKYAGATGIISTTEVFCLNILSNAVQPASTDSQSVTSVPGSSVANPNNVNCGPAIGGVTYNIAVGRQDTTTPINGKNVEQHNFSVVVSWDSITGYGKDQVTLSYNLDE